MTIFCPNDHLVLDLPACPSCGWLRPPSGKPGVFLWGPLAVRHSLGGEHLHQLARGCAAGNILLMPAANGRVLLWLDAQTGQVLRAKELPEGLCARGMTPHGDRILVALWDERPPHLAGTGCIASVDPHGDQVNIVWKAVSQMLSRPVISGDVMLVHAGTGRLHAFESERFPRELLWEKDLGSWQPSVEPCVVGGRVVVTEKHSHTPAEGCLVVFDLRSGQELQRVALTSPLRKTPQAAGEMLITHEGEQLVIRSLSSLEILWQERRRVYTPVIAAGELAYVILRGSKDRAAPDYYSLACVDPRLPGIGWSAPVPFRTSQMVFCPPDSLILCGDHGQIAAFSLSERRLAWQLTLGTPEDPPRVELLAWKGRVYCGTGSGQAAALWVAPPPDNPGSPEALEAEGRFEEAAEGWALQKEWSRSAELFRRLNRPLHAQRIFERGELWLQAARQAEAQERWGDAEEDFRKAGGLYDQARMVMKSGDALRAADLFEQSAADAVAGGAPQDWRERLALAAQCFEHGGKLSRALELFTRLGDQPARERVIARLPADQKSIQILEDQGLFAPAAAKAHQAGLFEWASKLYQKDGNACGEAGALEDFLRVSKDVWADRWAVDRLAKILFDQGKYLEEAQAWERLCATQIDLAVARKIADAYHRAARQRDVEGLSPAKKEEVARLFDTAMKWFDKFDGAMVQTCWRRSLFLRERPFIIIEGKFDKVLTVDETSQVRLTVRNDGFGPAEEISISVNEDRFQFERSVFRPFSLRQKTETEKEISICPRPLELGGTGEPPLVLKWSWKDLRGSTMTGENIKSIRVKEKGQSTGSALPAIIKNEGVIYMMPEGSVTNIAGDAFSGNAQKGDREEYSATINRGSTPAGQAKDDKSKPQAEGSPCRGCGEVVPAGVQYCRGCGAEVTREQSD